MVVAPLLVFYFLPYTVVSLSFTAGQFEGLEGSPVRPIVTRTLISLARNLTVIITPAVLPVNFPRTPTQFPAQARGNMLTYDALMILSNTSLVDFDGTPQTIVFASTDPNERISDDVDIDTINDNFNERIEIFFISMSVPEDIASGVNLTVGTTIGQIVDDDRE